MKKRIALGIISITVLSLISWAGYQSGYSLGLAKGYTAGYNAGIGSFPRLDMNNITFTEGVHSIHIGQLTVTGEQHIINKIKNLPNMKGIINTR